MIKTFPYLLGLGALVGAALSAGGATAQTRVWGAAGVGGEIFVTDCRDCGEDIGLTIACQGEGGNGLVQVPFAAVDPKPTGPTNEIDFEIDGKVFSFAADTVEQGMVGFVPSFEVKPNDPLIGSLQAGRRAAVRFFGIDATIGLRGSGEALDIFIAHCGWNDPQLVAAAAAKAKPVAPIAVTPAAPIVVGKPAPAPIVVAAPKPAITPPLTVSPPPAAAPAIDGPQWFTSDYDDNGRSMLRLTYGLPETDAVLVSTACAKGAGARSVSVDLLVDFGGARDGDPVGVTIRAGGQTFNYSGKVFESGEEYAGVRIDVGSRAPLWAALRTSADISVGIDGGGSATASAAGAVDAIGAFTGGCFGSSTAVPAVQVMPRPSANVPAVNIATGQQTPVTLPLGGTVAKSPLVQLGVTLPATPVSAPAMPSYVCDDGSAFQMMITTGASGDVAEVKRPGQAQLALAEIPAPFGRKFTDGKTTLHVANGATVQIADSAGRQFCERQLQ